MQLQPSAISLAAATYHRPFLIINADLCHRRLCEDAAWRTALLMLLASARGGSTISAASVDISCGACALLERRHVASSQAPPEQIIQTTRRCAHPLRIPMKTTAAAPFFPYFQA
jgi:hypothetical protein